MYEERKEKFSIRTIIIQILLIVLVVFLLLWLFPSKSYVKNYADNAFTDKLQPLYSQIFNQNITTMKEAAITYFTTDRLPSKIGDNVTMTLKEMQEKKLVLDLIDSNNNKCDVNESYVKIVKEKNEYLMTVNLKCSDKTDYIEVHLGCYDYCGKNGICEKKEETKPSTPVKPVVTKKYIYEYEKITDGVWGPWGPWSKWTTTEATKTDYRNVETKIEKVQTGTKTVIVDVTSEIDATPIYTTTYSCPSGYTLNGTKCSKPFNTTATINAIPRTIYSCPSGYTLNGTKCTKPISTSSTIDAIPKTTYGEWKYIGEKTYNTLKYNTNTSKFVDIGSSTNTDCTTNCTYETYSYMVFERTATTTYSCPSGYTLNGTKCTKPISTSSTIDAKTKTSYSCQTGFTLNGTKCTKPISTSITINATKNTSISSYKCDVGTLEKTKCVIITQKNELEKVFTDITYYRTQTREFISGDRVTKWSTSKNDKALLEQDYVLTGNKDEIK